MVKPEPIGGPTLVIRRRARVHKACIEELYISIFFEHI
jgi:hypothetical protein